MGRKRKHQPSDDSRASLPLQIQVPKHELPFIAAAAKAAGVTPNMWVRMLAVTEARRAVFENGLTVAAFFTDPRQMPLPEPFKDG